MRAGAPCRARLRRALASMSALRQTGVLSAKWLGGQSFFNFNSSSRRRRNNSQDSRSPSHPRRGQDTASHSHNMGRHPNNRRPNIPGANLGRAIRPHASHGASRHASPCASP
jgi:hypothetical protein